MSLAFWILCLFALYKEAKTKEIECVFWSVLALLCGIFALYLF